MTSRNGLRNFPAHLQPRVNAAGERHLVVPGIDQRGLSRPWGPACDIGAFELHDRR